MWASVAVSEARVWLAVLLWACSSAVAAAAPERVVSINLCTDQMAMLLAKPGQLVSVSFLSQDTMNSWIAETARAWPANYGQAEDVFLLRPDLVLAGTYTANGATQMLRRLGVNVAELPPERSFEDIRNHLMEVGRLLGQEQKARQMVEKFDRRLEAITVRDGPRLRVALYSPNGYTTGKNTLADAAVTAAGLTNIAAEAGVPDGGVLPLEQLIMLDPDIIITGTPYPGASQAEAIMQHPALTALNSGRTTAQVTDAYWSCGTPYVLEAIEEMVRIRTRALATR